MDERDFSIEHFEEVFTQIIRDTITLDVHFNHIISLYYGRENRLDKIKEELLEKEFFTTKKKAEIIYRIAEEKFGNKSKYLLKRIDACLEYRNKLAHTIGIEDKWVTTGYQFEKNKQKIIKSLKEIQNEYYKNYREIMGTCISLIQELRCDLIVLDLTKCVAVTDKTKSGQLKIVELDFVNSKNEVASLYNPISGEFNKEEIELAKNKIKDFIHEKYSITKEKKFDIELQELEYPEDW